MKYLKYRMTKEIRFESSCTLDGLNCGHSYQSFITFSAKNLGENGSILGDQVFKEITRKLNNKHLNNVFPQGVDPTLENICRFIFEIMNSLILQLELEGDVDIEKVRVKAESREAEVWAVEQ